MSLIQTSVIGRKLQRLLRLTELPDSILAPDVVPVIVVEDVSDPLVGDARGCAGAAEQQPVAAEASIVSLVRVSRSYNLKVTKFWFSSPNNNQISVIATSPPLTGLTATINTSFRDFSLPGRPSSTLGIDSLAAVPPGRILFRGRVLANELHVVEIDFDIGAPDDTLPLTDLSIVAEIVNTALTAGFEWTESPPLG